MSDKPASIWRKPLSIRVRLGCCLLITLAILCAMIAYSEEAAKTVGLNNELTTLIVVAVLIGITALVAAILFVAIVVSDQVRGRLFSRRMAGKCVFGLACLATLIALFYAVENWRGKRAWNAYVQEQTSKGEKLDLAAFVPPPVPDNQNLCLAPLLKPIMDFSINPFVGRDTNALALLDRFDPDWSIETYRNALPVGEKKDAIYQAKSFLDQNGITNGWINLSAWQACYRAGTNLTGIPPTNSAAVDVLLALRSLDAELAQLKRDAAVRPLARWPVQYDLSNPWMILLPHLAKEKQFVFLFQLRAAAFLAAGDTESAVSDLGLGFRLADSSRDEPFVISQLVRAACLDILLQPLREGLARRQFSDAQLAVFEKRLAQADLLAGYQLSMHVERAGHSTWSKLTQQSIRDVESLVGWPGSERNRDWIERALLIRFAPSGWIYQNQLALCRWQDEHELPQVDAAARRVFPQQFAEATRAFQELHGRFTVLIRFWNSVKINFEADKPIRSIAYTQTLLDEARLACALERHRLVHGAYPETLNALAPQFIAALPHDLITGQPLKYRRTEDDRCYLLYSVGWNETDEHGALVLKKSGQPDPEKGDWVWQLPVP